MTRVLILAAGEGSRWGNYRGTQKHKLVIEGEVLIERTVKQFLKYCDDVVVVGSDKSYEVDGARCYIPPQNHKWKDMAKFYSSKDIWSDERTVMVFGDVYFTDKAVKTIMTNEDEWIFFLRKGASRFTGKNWKEIFGIAFNGSSNNMIKDEMVKIIEGKGAPRVGGWHLFKSLVGSTTEPSMFEKGGYVNIDDWTEDFDFPEDLDTWEEKRAAYKNK